MVQGISESAISTISVQLIIIASSAVIQKRKVFIDIGWEIGLKGAETEKNNKLT